MKTQMDEQSDTWSAFHEQALVCDIHHDWSLEVAQRRRSGARAVLESVYLQELRDGGVDFDLMSVGGDHKHFSGMDDFFEGSLRMLDFMLADIEESPSFVLARSATDILEAKKAGRRSIMLTIEGARPVREDLWRLRTFYQLGVRSLILTWFKANAVGDGINELRGGGLTDFGREVVREMNRLGMIIDIAQCSPATFTDVANLSESPIIASHSNANGVCEHPRNLTDGQLEAIAKLNGVVGVHTFPRHLSEHTPTIETLLDHIDYIVRKIGEGHVALGLNMTVAPEAAVSMFHSANIDYTGLYVEGITSMSRFGNITKGLLSRGYSFSTIEKILGGNFHRVVKDVVG